MTPADTEADPAETAAPAVSVILPVYDAGPYLREAVESVLNQTWTDFEFLVTNDGSTDGSGAILDEYAAADPRIRLTHRGNAGYTHALNAMLGRARGRFVARMDADDACRPERLAKQVAHLEAHPGCVAVGTGVRNVDPDGDPIDAPAVVTDHAGLVAGLLREPGAAGSIAHPSVTLRADAVRAVGGYRGEFEPAEDLDLWLRLAEVGTLANLPEVLLDYRIHPASVTASRRGVQIGRAHEALRQARARRGEPFAPPPEAAPDADYYRHGARVRIVRQACAAGNFATARKHVRELAREGLGGARLAALRVQTRLGPAHGLYRAAARAKVRVLGRLRGDRRPAGGAA